MKALGKWTAIAVGVAAAVAIVQAIPGSDSEAETMEGRTPVEVASLGPQVGESVPDFRLPDQYGEMRSLESVLGPRGGMLLFHRSADW